VGQLSFVMTYPCFVLLDAKSKAEAVQLADLRCVCVFTDAHAVEEYYRGRHPESGANNAWTLRCRGPGGLLRLLRGWLPGLETQGVRHVALDPIFGRRTLTGLIADLIKALEEDVLARSFRVGDEVRVTGGPFAGCRGSVARIDEVPTRVVVETLKIGRPVLVLVEPQHVKLDGARGAGS
jgi:hypothetical protein